MLVEQIKQSVDKKDVISTRIMLKDLLVAEGRSDKFLDAFNYAKSRLNLFETHMEFTNNKAKNIQDYITMELTYLSRNFSEERMRNLLSSYDILKMHGNVPLYHEEDSPAVKEMKVVMTKRRFGWGSIIGGVFSIGAGIITSHTAATLAGVAAVVIGGTLVLTTKKPKFGHNNAACNMA